MRIIQQSKVHLNKGLKFFTKNVFNAINECYRDWLGSGRNLTN